MGFCHAGCFVSGENFCFPAIRIIIKVLRKYLGPGKCERVLILNFLVNKVDQECTCFFFVAVKLEGGEIENSTFIMLVRFKYHTAAKADRLENI